MGKEAHVRARFADGEDEGRLLYEPPKLIFRGRSRHVVEGEALAGVRADGADLVVGATRFTLGERAATAWANAILHPKSRLDKLGVKAGRRVAVVDLDDADFAAELAARVAATHDADPVDLLFYGADGADDLARIDGLLARLADGGAIWIVRPKGRSSKISDVEVMNAARAVGLVDNKVCAFSESRTALRFTRRRDQRA
jgi:hypothetical protein